MDQENTVGKNNEKEVQAINSIYARLLDALPTMIWRSGLDTKFIYFNKSWLDYTGRLLEEEIGDGWIQGLYPDDVDHWLSTYLDAFQRQEPFELEYRLKHHSGNYRWVLVIGRPFIGPDEKFAGYVGTCFDLSEQKRMEKALVDTNRVLESTNTALRENEAMFKGLFEHAQDAVIVVDQEGSILHTNQQTETLFGFSRHEMIGQNVEMLMPPAIQDIHRGRVAGIVESLHVQEVGKPLALFGQRKDGTRFPVDINLGPLKVGDHLAVLATVRDTTSRKQAEEAIREREKLLTTAAASAPIAFFKVERSGIISLFLGRNLKQNVEMLGRSIYEVFSDIPLLIQCFERALSGETSTRVIESEDLILEITFAPLQDETGEINAAVGVAADITRHRMVEEALRESEAHFRTIFQNALLGISLVDLHGWIVETNPAMQEKLGYPDELLRKKHFLDLVHPEDKPLAESLLTQMLKGEKEQFRVDLRLVGAETNVLMVRLAMSLFRSQDGTPVYGIVMVENITAQKQAEAELAELHRRLSESAELERLHLSQELHDGPLQDLQAIAFRISMLEEMVPDGDAQEEIGSLKAELSRVVQSLRSISGELRPPALAPFGLEKAIRSHAEHFQAQHPDISIHLHLASDGKNLSERVRLALFRIYQQSLANIANHANAKNVYITFALHEDQIELRIEDDGRGFDVPSRWIDLVRQGHFGLVGSMERAEAIGGKMEIQSTRGQGTTVQVLVPRREEDQIPTRERFTLNFNLPR